MCSEPRCNRRALALSVLGLAVLLAGCGKKGDPIPPPRAIPQATADLTVRQRGDRVLAELTYPKTTVAGLPLAGLGSATLFVLERPAPPAGAALTVVPQELAAARPVVELAGPALGAAIVGDRIRLDETLPEPLPEPAVARVYAVRTTGPGGEASPWSNVAVLVPRPAPPAPAGLEARPLPDGVEVTWTAVAEAAAGYAVLRRAAEQPDWGLPLAVVDAGVTRHLDATARYGERYVYSVLALVQREPAIESAPRAEREIDYRDRFAPEPPSGLRAVALPGEVRLLWEASPTADVTGYRLERAEAGGEFHAATAAPLTGLEHVDSGLPAGAALAYRVVALDGAGNVSAPTAIVEVTLP